MAQTVLDEFVTTYDFKVNKGPLRGIEARVDRIRARLDSAARGFAVVGGALTGALYATGRAILGFETQSNALEAATQANAEEMARMREQAKELGRTTAFSAGQAAEAQKLLGLAGLSVNEIISTMPAVLALAAAGQLELGEAAAITTSIMAAFDLEAEESRRVADVLAAAASSAKTTVSDMGIAFRQAAPLAHQLGIPLEEVAAMLATLQNNGLRAEMAGTSVRNMMVRLKNPTSEVHDALKTLGVDYERVDDLLNQGRLADAVRLLADAGLDAGTAAKLFGAETVSAALIMASSTDDVDALTASLENAEGRAASMAATQMKGLPGVVLEFKSALEGALLSLGDAGLTGWLERAGRKARDFINDFTNLPPEIRRLVAGAIAAGPALIALGGALKGLSFALAGFVPMLSAVGLLFSWWLIPLALLAAGGVLVVKNWESVVAFFEQRFPGVVRWVEDVGERARRAWAATLAWLQGPGHDESVFDWLSRPLDGVFDWLKGAWAQAVRVIEDPAPLLKALAVWWEGARSAVVDWYRRLVQRFNEIDWRALGTTVAGAVNESLRMGLDALAVVSVWFDRLRARIGEVDWAGLGEHIGGSIGDAMVSVWRASTNFMRGVAAEDGEDIGNRLLLGFVKAITGAAKLQTAVKRAIFDAFAGAVGGLGGVLIDAASEELVRFVILGQALADAIIAGITSRLGEFAGGLPEQVARVFLGRGVAGALFAGAGSAIALRPHRRHGVPVVRTIRPSQRSPRLDTPAPGRRATAPPAAAGVSPAAGVSRS